MKPNFITIIFFTQLITLTTKILASDPDPVQDYCLPNPDNKPESVNTLQCRNSSEVTADDFVFTGSKKAGVSFSQTGLASVYADPTTFPGLNTLGLSFVRADLRPGGINPPHFHPRATEIAYVIRGRVYSGFIDSENRIFAKILEQGEAMVYPRGLVHFQMNVGTRSHATVFGCFNSQNPGMQKIPNVVFGSGIDGVLLEKAFGLSSKQLEKMRRKFDTHSSED